MLSLHVKQRTLSFALLYVQSVKMRMEFDKVRYEISTVNYSSVAVGLIQLLVKRGTDIVVQTPQKRHARARVCIL
jgi:hypothetical protein